MWVWWDWAGVIPNFPVVRKGWGKGNHLFCLCAQKTCAKCTFFHFCSQTSPFAFPAFAGHRCFGAAGAGAGHTRYTCCWTSAPTDSHAHTQQQQKCANRRHRDNDTQINHVCTQHRLPLQKRGAHTQNKDGNTNYTHNEQMTNTQTCTRAHMKMRAHAAHESTQLSTFHGAISPHTHLFFCVHASHTHTGS